MLLLLLPSGVHKGGFSKGGFSNTNIIITHKLLNHSLLNPPQRGTPASDGRAHADERPGERQQTGREVRQHVSLICVCMYISLSLYIYSTINYTILIYCNILYTYIYIYIYMYIYIYIHTYSTKRAVLRPRREADAAERPEQDVIDLPSNPPRCAAVA